MTPTSGPLSLLARRAGGGEPLLDLDAEQEDDSIDEGEVADGEGRVEDRPVIHAEPAELSDLLRAALVRGAGGSPGPAEEGAIDRWQICRFAPFGQGLDDPVIVPELAQRLAMV